MPLFRIALLISLVVTLSVGSFFSCSDPISPQTDPEPEAPQYIRPLTIGNVWYGTTVRYGQDGPLDTTGTTNTVVGDTTVSDTVWTEIFYETDDTSQFAYSWSSYSRNDSVGQWEALALGVSANLLAKYPAEALDTFTIDQGVTSVVIVASVDSMVAVPAGEFSCYNYRYLHLNESGPNLKVSYFFSPGVGKIRSELYKLSDVSDTTGVLDNTWELDSFDLVTPDSNIIM